MLFTVNKGEKEKINVNNPVVNSNGLVGRVSQTGKNWAKVVTIIDCDITNDLSFAKVYFTVFDESKKESTIKALNHAKSFIRGELSKRVQIRHTPELTFIFDESIEYGNRIEKIIEKINEDDK